jgi:hypothetical protein
VNTWRGLAGRVGQVGRSLGEKSLWWGHLGTKLHYETTTKSIFPSWFVILNLKIGPLWGGKWAWSWWELNSFFLFFIVEMLSKVLHPCSFWRFLPLYHYKRSQLPTYCEKFFSTIGQTFIYLWTIPSRLRANRDANKDRKRPLYPTTYLHHSH